jgi:hypothetical protein
VHNAEVDIYENGNLLETLKHNNEGVYIGSIKPEIGKNYKLKVFGKTNVLDVDAIIPNPVLINNVNFALVIDEYGSGNVEIAVKFNDPPNQENYYRITVFPNPMVYVDDRYPTGFWLSSNDLVIKSLFGGDNALNSSPENGYLIFNDQLINGKDYELKINMVDYEIFAYLSEQETVTRGYTVRLHSISRDYYLYLKSRQLNSYTSDDPFSEPVPIYSNINGGGGIWAAYSISEKNILVDYSR